MHASHTPHAPASNLKRSLFSCTLGLATGLLALPATAATDPAHRPSGMSEIPDAELGQMRGRYTVGPNAVAWFGVSMISTWQTPTGQIVQGSLQVGMDFAGGTLPTVTYTPTVSITSTGDAPPPGGGDGLTRSIDAAGLANASGVVQSVQVAGDRNSAYNVTQLTVRDDTQGAAGFAATLPSGASRQYLQAGLASASASFDGEAARVLLMIEGQGAVEQWIRSGSLGQSIRLTSDRQFVSNRLEVELVRRQMATNTQLVQNVAQALQSTRGLRNGGI